jgi:hypothetical protein
MGVTSRFGPKREGSGVARNCIPELDLRGVEPPRDEVHDLFVELFRAFTNDPDPKVKAAFRGELDKFLDKLKEHAHSHHFGR